MSKIVAPFVRSPYNYDAAKVSDETGLKCEDPSLASQALAQECDINFIVEQFIRSPEEMLAGHRIQPQYGDFSELPTNYHEALNLVRDAESRFNSLPARVRTRFDNDPQKLLNFVADDKNYDEAVQLGLIPGKPGASGDAPLSQQAGGASSGRRGTPTPAKPSGKASNEPQEGKEGGSGEA